MIDFINEDEGSEKPAKYVRVSDNTPMSKILTLLVDYWSIGKPYRPNLALSVIGGAKNFQMEGRKREVFKQGLISAAKTTNAIILTGGTNTGEQHSKITIFYDEFLTRKVNLRSFFTSETSEKIANQLFKFRLDRGRNFFCIRENKRFSLSKIVIF